MKSATIMRMRVRPGVKNPRVIISVPSVKDRKRTSSCRFCSSEMVLDPTVNLYICESTECGERRGRM